MNALKTYVRCTDPSCGWDGEDWDTVESPKSAQACPECGADTTPGSFCISCLHVPVDDPGYEECTGCCEKNEAEFQKRFQDTQKAIRTHNDWKLALAAGESARAHQLHSELRELLGIRP